MTEKKKLIIATYNEGKVKEIRKVLADLPVEILSLKELAGAPVVDEDGNTFVANALKKAREICDFYGEITLADDSGLEVEALGGLPGVRSARFSGPDADDEKNNRLLLQKLKETAEEQRRAAFKCALVVADPGGEVEIIEESCTGKIATEPYGEGGFGYDPLFIYEPAGLTFGQMDPDSKNKISHRGKALNKLKPVIQRLLTPDS